MTKQIKLMTVMASAIMFFAACSSDKLEAYQGQPDTNLESPSNAISFGTYMGKTGTTRAGKNGAITTAGGLYKDTDTNDDANGFGVFGYLKNATIAPSGSPSMFSIDIAPNFMYNQQVKASAASDPTWSYTPVKYWPNGEDGNNAANNPSNTATQGSAQYLNFFAYAPYVPVTAETGVVKGTNTWGITALTTNTATSNPTISYTLDKTNFVDLLWGVRNYSSESDKYGQSAGTETTPTADAAGNYYNVNLTKQNTTETVDFLFKHALAKIGGATNSFQIVYDIDGNGTATAGYGSNDANTLVTVSNVTIKNKAANVVKSGTFDIVQGKWTANAATSATAGEIIDLSASAANIATPIKEGTVTYDSGWKIDTNSQNGVTVSPQNVFASAPAAAYFIPGGTMSLEVSITYTVRTRDENLSAGWSQVTQTITNSVDLSSLSAPNKYYKILIHLGLTSVKFSATVAEWTEASGGDDEEIWLPSNVVVKNDLALSVSPAQIAKAASSTTVLTVQDNSVTVVPTSVTGYSDWLSYDSGTQTFTATENSTGADRSQTITVTYNSGTYTNTNSITITQAGS